MNLIKHIEKEIQKHELEGFKFLLAVSGGEDSMALLHAFHQNEFPFKVAHVNYQLRGEDSDLDQKIVEDYCRANSIECFVNRVSISSKSGIQEEARKLRYSWFQELLKEHKLHYAVTAHHKNDSVETILFNLLRGTGLEGLTGISALNDVAFRPFLNVEKLEISEYCQANKVPFRLDKSNLETKYSRNKLRNQVFTLFQEINPQYVKHIDQTSQLVNEANDAMQYVVNEIWDSNIEKVGYGFVLNLQSWSELSFSKSILFGISKRIGLDSTQAKESLNLLGSTSGKQLSLGQMKVWRNRDEIIFQDLKNSPKSEFFLEIPVVGNYEIPQGEIAFCTEKNLGVGKTEKNELICQVENLKWPLVLRTWRHGDRFQPFGMKGTQKVSDLLVHNKVSALEKESVLVLESAGSILWVLGYRSSEETRVSSDNQHYLKALISELK